MRLFIALNFDDRIKKYLKTIQTDVKSISSSGKFSHEENLHLTVLFLGEVPLGKITHIKQAMNDVKANAFDLHIGGLGKFKRDQSNIVWVGVKQNTYLTNIYSQIYNSLKSKGFTIENREYKPHLTIGREVVLTGDLKDINSAEIVTHISKLSLMKSERINGKLTYTEIFETAFY